MPAKAEAAKKVQQIPSSLPQRIDIRVNGHVVFTNACYDAQVQVDEDTVTFTAALQPTLIDSPLVYSAPRVGGATRSAGNV